MNLRPGGSIMLALVVGCGPTAAGDTSDADSDSGVDSDSASDSNSNSSSGGSTDPSAGTSDSTSASGTTGASGSDTTGVDPTTGAPGTCDPLLDHVGVPVSVSVRIENGTSEVRFLPIFCGDEFLGVTDAAGAIWPPPFCMMTCQEHECIDCGACPAGVVRVEPGGSWSLTWPGELFEILPIPAECSADFGGCGESTCPARRIPGTGEEVQLEVAHATEAECLAAAALVDLPPESCECMLSPDGSCTNWAGFDLPASMVQPASLTVGQTQITIVLE